MLTYGVGEPCQSLASQRKTPFEGLFQDDGAFGELFSQVTLANGDMLYQHLSRYASRERSSSMFGGVTQPLPGFPIA